MSRDWSLIGSRTSIGSRIDSHATRSSRSRQSEQTAQGRELEIVRIGRASAPYRVFVRARAHPWEPGGNWVVEGLIRRLLQGDADARGSSSAHASTCCRWRTKMAWRAGRTRFNLRGKDLNRNWDKPADPTWRRKTRRWRQWLETTIAAGRKPHFAVELHNDGGGLLHISRPPVPGSGATSRAHGDLRRHCCGSTPGSRKANQHRLPQQRHTR